MTLRVGVQVRIKDGVYERGVCSNPRVYQLERESIRIQWLIDCIVKA
jgi:hypothetical protein